MCQRTANTRAGKGKHVSDRCFIATFWFSKAVFLFCVSSLNLQPAPGLSLRRSVLIVDKGVLANHRDHVHVKRPQTAVDL